ncbi:MAG: cell surface protein SprA, partial [Gemmatimonadales bacterium]
MVSNRGAGLAALAMLLAGTVAAQEEPAAVATLVLRFGPTPDLEVRVPAVLRPGGMLGLRAAFGTVGERWEDQVRAELTQARATRFRERLLVSLGLRPGQITGQRRRPAGIPRPEEIGIPRQREEIPQAFRAVAAYADLGVDIRARLELKLDKLKNARCTAEDVNNPALGCQTGFPAPSFGAQFGVRAGGIVSDRVHVAVDFDSEREFSANNNINVFYQGLEDEILRRIEVGNVTFRSSATRFVSAAIPGNSFGVQAEAQLGALEFRTIVAQQKGSAIRTRQFTVGEETTQPVGLEARDLDFVQERFFFVINPKLLPSYPDVDVLNIGRDTLPQDLQLAAIRVYRLRAQSGQVGGNANLGGIDAVAIRSDSPQRVGPFTWELLVEGQDYYLDPSGIWIGLGSQLGIDDFLAVSYVTVAGDTVGTFPSENGVLDTLELIHEPRRGPEVPTFYHVMRNVYRLAGAGADRSTLELTLRVGTSETPLDAEGTYLSRLGMALPNDESSLDEFNRVFPRDRDPGGGEPVRGAFAVFPHLMPFADSARLQPAERNDSLYRTPTYLLGTQGPPPRFTLQIDYEATGAGSRTSLSLGSIAMRSGSERLYVGDRLLQRGRDYEIDYVLGQVTFLRPDALFSGPTSVRVEFEENQLFDEAPKTILGASGTYALRGIGEISAIGVFQQERTVNTRPILGFEPEAGFIGGLSTDLEFRSDGLTRALDALPLIRTNVPSTLLINGEVALSAPNANRTGAAYIEDFDQEAALSLPLTQQVFQHGSRPTSGIGLPPTHLGPSGQFEAADAVPLVWQNLVLTGSGTLQFRPQDIDSTIRTVGTGVNYETLLWLSLKPDTVGGAPDPFTGEPRWLRPHTPGPRWRSITQPLGGGSGIGADLSRVEFLEFWVLEDAQRTAQEQGAYMVFDFGTVLEDAVAFAPESLSVSGTDTTFSGFQFIGVDRLDTEKDSLTNVFNAQLDDIGIHGDRPDTLINAQTGEVLESYPLCDLGQSGRFSAYPIGWLDARCTVFNG